MTTAPAPVRENLQPPARHSWFWTWRVVSVVMSGMVLLNLVGAWALNSRGCYNAFGWPEIWLTTAETTAQADQSRDWVMTSARDADRLRVISPQ